MSQTLSQKGGGESKDRESASVEWRGEELYKKQNIKVPGISRRHPYKGGFWKMTNYFESCNAANPTSPVLILTMFSTL